MSDWTDELDLMLEDAEDTFGGEVIVRRVQAGDLSADTSTRAETQTDYTVPANRLPPTQEHRPAGGDARARANERVYEIVAATLGVEPRPGWRIGDPNFSSGRTTFEVTLVEQDCERRNYILYTRRMS